MHRIILIVLAALSISGRCAAVVPGNIMDAIAGYWPFDETSGGVVHEASGQGLNGSLVNYPGGQGDWVAGQIGGSLHFGGLAAQQSVQVPDFTKPTTSLSLSAWVWADTLPQWATIAANWNGSYGALNYEMLGSHPYLSMYFADAANNIATGSESPSFVPALSLGQWHHVALVVTHPFCHPPFPLAA